MVDSRSGPLVHVLVVDDDLAVRQVVRRGLEREGFAVSEAGDGATALATAEAARPAVAVVDLHLPDTSGLDLMAALRERDAEVHIIMLTGAGSEGDRVRGLVSGADDYMVKPFSVRELAARVASVQRRRSTSVPPTIEIGGLRIDTVARQVSQDLELLDLTRREFDLLTHLAANPGRTFTREELLQQVWESSADWQSSATVTEHVRRLRQKIEMDPDRPQRIVTMRGAGYRFEAGSRSPTPRPDAVVTPAVDTGDDAMVILVGATIVHATRAALELVGVDAVSDVVGADVGQFVAPSSREAVAERRELLEQGRWPRPEAMTVLRLDGQEMLVEVTSMPVRWDGQPATQVTLWPLAPNTRETRVPVTSLRSDVPDAEMRSGIDRGEFVVHYQPVVWLDTGRWCGVEALVRWQHSERGLLTPTAFIGAAERSGAIVDIGQFVLDEVCRQWATWHAAGHQLQVAVNLSGRQLAEPGLSEGVRRAMEASSVPPGQLWLEVTETELVHDLNEAAAVLHRLHELGARFSIDDFGTGWASLAYLRQFPVHALKLDRVFVDGLGRSSTDAAIVSSVLRLAHELELVTIAEGIETPDQLARLVQMGCRLGQGFLFGHPAPADALEIGRP